MELIKRLWAEEDGQGMTEYGLIIALVAILLIGTLVLFKDKLVAIFSSIINDPNLP